MEERSLEIKVGVRVLLGLVGVIALLWLMGELRFSSGTELLVRFAHTGNVVKGAPVKLGGVRVGQVAAIELQPGLKILYTSGYTRDTIMQDGRLEAGVELLPKPFTFKTLASKVREVLDQ